MPRHFANVSWTAGISLTLATWGFGQEVEPPLERDKPASVATVASQANASIVTIHAQNRDGNQRGLGTGFAIGDGLIATNLHVIGEGRAFRVETADGRQLKVQAVHAWDRTNDLAVLKIDAEGNEALVGLPLAPPNSLEAGDPIVVVGNPLGLKHSVVSGVLSGYREVEGRAMLQLAIPVEPGNSGGPVIDMLGRVHGVVTLKSLLSENLGFAIRVDSLKELLTRATPVPLEKWQRVGGVDTAVWKPLQAHWRQRAATLNVRGTGSGFGGRALCLRKQAPPQPPYEIAVSVKMEEESGAAGLVFRADGKDRHYGFYPSNGNIRFTCFLGPSVYSWKVLHNAPTEHYQPGKWNRLKVRVEKQQMLCYVNEHLVFTTRDQQLISGSVGLAKFRDTTASFREFEIGKEIASLQISETKRQQLSKAIGQLGPLKSLMPADLVDLIDAVQDATTVLSDEAEALEQRAQELRKIQQDLRVADCCRQLKSLIADAKAKQQPTDLAFGALLIAQLDVADLNVQANRDWIQTLANRLRQSLPANATTADKLARLDQFLFVDNAIHGSHHEYYHRANSHLHRVLEDREGLPITLSILYITIGRQIGLQLEGVGLPGHFIVRHETEDGPGTLIDVFHGGTRLTREQAAKIALERAGVELRDEHLKSATPSDILDRMLRNLLGVAQRNEDKPGMLRYLEALVAMNDESVADRGMRAVLRYETGRKAAAVADLDWILGKSPDGIDLNRVRQMRELFSR